MQAEFFRKTPPREIGRKVDKLIASALKGIRLPVLREAAVRSLRAFAQRQYETHRRSFAGRIDLVLAAVVLSRGGVNKAEQRKAERTLLPSFTAAQVENPARYGERYSGIVTLGVPLKKYAEDYLRENVRPALDRLCREQARDPDDVSGRNTLRNRAEMEVRYQGHLDNIQRLRDGGARLVVASVHSDCSERCRPWQGRVYSLDGTSGTTDDGRKYVPLETATDVWYITKAGKRYKNGLLGFNCFDDKTEVYTSDGWKLFSQLTGDELFYTLDPQTRISEWHSATAYYRQKYDGDMIYLHNTSADLCVTPNHSLLYYTQKDKRLRFKPACEFSTATFMYGGQEWQGTERKTITLGGKEVETRLYCRFMAYYLADGSVHDKNSVKIAQQNNDEMFNELSALPFGVWHDKDKIVIRGKALREELAAYGTCTQKHVPEILKTLPRDSIREFLDAYLKTDGYTTKDSYLNERRRKPHKTLFTTSKRMANDLSELVLKAGYRPKVDRRRYAGKEIAFKNGTYRINYDLYVIHMNYRVNIMHVKKDVIAYKGYVYCVEVPNHTLLVRRNGRIQWCGNCRHYLTAYRSGVRAPRQSPREEARQYAITQEQRRLERNVREWKVRALTYKNAADKKSYAYARDKAQAWDAAYRKFCERNNRPMYPSRIKVI